MKIEYWNNFPEKNYSTLENSSTFPKLKILKLKVLFHFTFSILQSSFFNSYLQLTNRPVDLFFSGADKDRADHNCQRSCDQPPDRGRLPDRVIHPTFDHLHSFDDRDIQF